uniref:Uncharacterized protein n=1 Tax=Riptortus pedestris TaxID=329032 RepID=R4WSF3_RIPPE|nr:conserved hypothetical protein [Riptortus pedestris]
MGANPSTTRKLQIDNENDPATVIKVSEKVVQRIRSGAEKEAEQELAQQAKKVRSFKRSDNNTNNANIFDDGVPFVTARMIRQEVEDELQKNNKYWESRIKELQQGHERINEIMEREYIKSVEDIKRELPKLPPENAVPPCQDKKGNIIKCYKTYSKRPLLCAQEVEAFNCCMKESRLKVLSQK